MKLWQKVLVGLSLGAILGLFLQESSVILKPLGDVFIKLIRMIISPLIFFAVVGGILGMKNGQHLNRIGFKALSAYLFTTLFAISIGFFTAWIIQPGKGVTLDFTPPPIPYVSSPNILNFHAILDSLVTIIPDNALGALAGSNMLQVLFFSLFTGIVIHGLPTPQHQRFEDLFKLLSSLVFRMVNLIVQLSPLAAMGFTAWVVGTQGVRVLLSLGYLILSMLFACGIQYGVFGLLIVLWGKLKPWPFYKKSLEYQSLAFSTSSSKAALTTAMQTARYKLGVSKSTSSFVLPLGVSINMDGMAIYLGLCALFFAQATGHSLSVQDYFVLMVTATVGCIGGGGIPGGSIMMLPMILASVNLPIEGVALIAGVDRILDMIRSTLNITGDVMVTLLVDRSEGHLDETLYYEDQPPS